MSEPIRVLHIFASLDAGGVENFVMNIYRRIDRSAIQFDFAMTSGEKGLYDDEVLSLGGRIYYFDPGKRLETNLKELLTSEHFDIVHSHIFFYSGIVLGIAKKYNIPMRIAHAHNAHTGEARSAPRLLYEGLMRFIISKNATLMLGCSEKACKYVFGSKCMSRRNVSVFPDCIDCNRFAYNDAVRCEIRKSLGIEGKLVVGHVGHFAPAKNHEKILSVFKEISQKNSDAVLLLVGNGGLESSVREQAEALGISEQVVFAGAHTNVEDYYNAMDVFLFPSVYEGFGMALIEAQANGLSCVASDVVPFETNVTGNVVFLPLAAPDKSWANAVSVSKKRDCSAASNEIVREKYDINIGTQRLSEIYLGVM